MGVGQGIHVLASRVNNAPAREGVGLSTEAAHMVANEIVETRKVFQPANLSLRELLGGRKVFKVLMVGEDQHDVGRPFEVIAPLPKSVKDSKKLLVIDLVIELCRGHPSQEEGDQMNIPMVGGDLRDNGGNGVVGGVRLDDNGIIGIEMNEDGGLHEGFFKLVERDLVLQAPNELHIFPGETSQGNCCV